MSNGFKKYFSDIKDRFDIRKYLGYFLFIITIAIFCVLAATHAFQYKQSTLLLLEQMGYTIIAVISLALVVGLLGELSLGHAGFMSIGAFTGVICQQTIFYNISASAPVLSLILAMIMGAIMAGIFGFIIGLPALRLRGDYLAIVTLAFGEIIKVILQNIDFFGGALGLQNQFRFDSNWLFVIIFIVAFLVYILAQNFSRSKHGRAVAAIRDNEIAARSTGINVSFYKVFVFTLSAAIAGVAGVLYGAANPLIKATTFGYNYSINNILIIVIVGGMGNITGSTIAAVVITLLDVKLQTTLTGDKAAFKNLLYALVLVLLIIYRNAPGLANFREKYNFTKFGYWCKKKIYALFGKEAKAKRHRNNYSADWSKVPTKIDVDEVVSADMKKQDPTSTVDVEGDAQNER